MESQRKSGRRNAKSVSDMTVWSYKISRDYGFAPNPFFGSCTIACCKPDIRERANVGDLIFGCSAKELNIGERLICAMQVDEKISFDQYWGDVRFQNKKPAFGAGIAHAYGDNIYHSDGNGRWFQEDSHHSLEGGGWNEANASRDLKSYFVLVSRTFSYWGRNAIEFPPHLRKIDGDDLYSTVRNYRNGYSPAMQAAASAWFEELPLGRFGRPINWK